MDDMLRRRVWAALLLYSSLSLPSTTAASANLEEHLDRIWIVAQHNICDPEIARTQFTAANYESLHTRVVAAKDWNDLAAILNPFLLSFGISHTALITKSDLEYSLLRSVGSVDITQPKTHHIGAQFHREDKGFAVRCVWDGYPAQRVGLRRGDVIVSANGVPFHPLESFQSGSPVLLEVNRNQLRLTVPVRPVDESTHFSLFQAMKQSVRRLPLERHTIGYVHLWTCTSPIIEREFAAIVLDSLAGVDGMILDLRDGFGGVWYRYLDPFFDTRAGFCVTTVVHRDGTTSVMSIPQAAATAAGKGNEEAGPHRWFSGPLAVLINEGTRSGKEGLAYQFKKSRRATLVGCTTAGAFSGGATFFADEDHEYILYLAVNRLLTLIRQ